MPRKTSSAPSDFHHYLPISDELMQGGFYITSAGCGLIQPGEAYPKDRHPNLYSFTWADGRTLPEFSLILLTAGRGTFESHETGRVDVAAGMTLLLFPGNWHRYRPDPKTGWGEKWVQFNGPLAHELLAQRLITPEQPILAPNDPQGVEAALDRLLYRVHADASANSLLLSLQAMAVLAAVLDDTRGSFPPAVPRDAAVHADDVVVAAVDHIWTRSHNVLSVPDVASAVGVTRRTLERRLTATLGHSVLEEIVRCRFSRAERLLRSTNLPIKTVVTLAGFGSVENMRQVFLSRTHLSPGAYREHHHPRLDHRSGAQTSRG